jgi:cbb3-type cytochrome oxidase subunit 1
MTREQLQTALTAAQALQLSFLGFLAAAGIPSLLSLPIVWSVVTLLYRGKWHRAADDVALRFLATGAIFWGFTCVQGIAQSFRNFSMFVHFTNWVIGHSHLAFVADYSFWAFGLIYFIVPQMVRRPMYSKKLMEWHYWLTTGGMTVFMVTLWIAGLIQAQNWLTNSIPFIETVRSLQPYFAVRFFAGLTAGIGILCFAYNVWQTVRQPLSAPATSPAVVVSGD